jgi:hypothetical protein
MEEVYRLLGIDQPSSTPMARITMSGALCSQVREGYRVELTRVHGAQVASATLADVEKAIARNLVASASRPASR